MQAIIAGGGEALLVAVEGAEDDVDGGRGRPSPRTTSTRPTRWSASPPAGGPRSCSPRSGPLASAGALTVGLSCNEDTPLSAEAQYPIEVLVGPEVVAGSTRLKAGTAQKLVLNMISTIAMVRLGKTYGNLMVDLRVTNAQAARPGAAHHRAGHRRLPARRRGGAGRRPGWTSSSPS